MIHSNCWLWAKLEHRRLHREWVKGGRRKGHEPYWMRRPTRLRIDCAWLPDGLLRWIEDRIPHYLVGVQDGPGGAVVPMSYVPEDRLYRVPLWRLPRVVFFPGEVVRGDAYASTQAPRG